MDKIRLNIDGREITGFKGQTILEVALENGVAIPTLCFDGRLEIYGACGICVVEMEGATKLLRACATEIAGGMVIHTGTPRVREARKVNLELLLSQHRGDCRAPCSNACPAHTDCQGYVGLIANGKIEEALKLIKTKIPFAASIGRVCPHPCEEACRRQLVDEPISILNLKRFAADVDLSKPEQYLPPAAEPTGKKVCVAGGGPGGLSCAYYLAEMGHSVTVFDAAPKMGGMLRYGIPEYRLPKDIVDKEAALVEKMGVVFKNNVRVGTDVPFDSLRGDFDAAVVAIGAWESMPLRCPGSDMDGVFGGIEFLRKVFANEPISIGKSVAVVGGGNTAMDACRTAVRMGAEKVYIIYRRTKAEMPAEDIEIEEAEEEGVIFKFLVNPLEVIGENGRAAKLRLQQMQLGEPDASGRRRPEPVEGGEEILEVDTVVAALGQGIVADGFEGVELTRGNTIIADERVFTTNVKGVFAIGDCVNDGAGIAIRAIGDAKKAAASVDAFLAGSAAEFAEPYRVTRDDLSEEDFADIKREPRSRANVMAPHERKGCFLEVTETFDAQAAKKEASRCLECGCHDFFECKLISLASEYDVEPARFAGDMPERRIADDHPFITRDPNKCILCGLCVRICSEVVGSTALGFVDRGFDTVVKPAFEDALSETSCISCGNCVSVCPTGALQEKTALVKQVPLDTVKTETICAMCALGCEACVESYGGVIVKTTPPEVKGADSGVMCGAGRFGLSVSLNEGRITAPMIRQRGELVPVSPRDAFVYAAKKMEGLRARGEKTAVSIGQTFPLEDALAVKGLADMLGAEAFSFMNRKNGMAAVLGYDSSPNTLEETLGCNAIIVFGASLLRNPAVLSVLRRARKNGASITAAASGDEEFNLPCKALRIQDSTAFIKQMIKALIDSGAADSKGGATRGFDGFDELKASLSGVEPCEAAVGLAAEYAAAKKAMILFALDELSEEAATEIANLAVASGHIGAPRDGVFMLRQAIGSQVLADCGITGQADAAAGAKGLMIFGEDVDIRREGLEFLMVQDTHMTSAASVADVVFPLAVHPEIDGAYAIPGQGLRLCAKVVDAPARCRASDVARGVAGILECSGPAGAPGDARAGDAAARYIAGFGFDGNRARLQVAEDAKLFDALEQTSYIRKAVDERLP